jgi:hypothetical protein
MNSLRYLRRRYNGMINDDCLPNQSQLGHIDSRNMLLHDLLVSLISIDSTRDIYSAIPLLAWIIWIAIKLRQEQIVQVWTVCQGTQVCCTQPWRPHLAPSLQSAHNNREAVQASHRIYIPWITWPYYILQCIHKSYTHSCPSHSQFCYLVWSYQFTDVLSILLLLLQIRWPQADHWLNPTGRQHRTLWMRLRPGRV